MKKQMYVLFIVILSVLFFSSISQSAIRYGNYINNNYNYQIIIPLTWVKSESVGSSKHIMRASTKTHAEIKVQAYKSNDEDMEKIVHSETWYLRKVDPNLTKIIETENIAIKKNVTGKLLIFEYRSKKSNYLQRTLISVNDGIFYIIECKSPRNNFYKYEDIFTTAFASFKYLQGGARQEITSEEENFSDDEDMNSDLDDTIEELEEDVIEEDEQL